MKNVSGLLLEEHKLLYNAIEVARRIQKIEDQDRYHKLMHDIILFFRNYTEIYHHPKEQYILYPALLKHPAKIDNKLLHEISDNHEDFKMLIAEIENCYELHQYDQLKLIFSKYLDEMFEHISREDNIVLKKLNEILSEEELTTINTEFLKHDEHFGEKEELKELFYKISI